MQAEQREPLYAFLPSYIDLVDLSWEQLSDVRRELLALRDREGISAVRKLARQKRRHAPRVMKLLKSVSGKLSKRVYGRSRYGKRIRIH